MKKIFFYIITIILGASIPIYYLLVWEPLKSEEAISSSMRSTTEKILNSSEVSNGQDISNNLNKKKKDSNKDSINIKEKSNMSNSSNSNENIITGENEIEGLSIKQSDIEDNLFGELEESEKLEIDRMLKSLSIVDIVKVNDHFSDKYDGDNVREGFSLVKKRMSLSDYEEFKSIISRYIDLDIIEEKI